MSFDVTPEIEAHMNQPVRPGDRVTRLIRGVTSIVERVM